MCYTCMLVSETFAVVMVSSKNSIFRLPSHLLKNYPVDSLEIDKIWYFLKRLYIFLKCTVLIWATTTFTIKILCSSKIFAPVSEKFVQELCITNLNLLFDYQRKKKPCGFLCLLKNGSHMQVAVPYNIFWMDSFLGCNL